MRRWQQMARVAATSVAALALGACASGGRERLGGEAAATDTAAAPQPTDLTGSKWRLEDLAGKGVVDRVAATLEFTGDGMASGHGSCNRFRGGVAFEGDSISFGPLIATRMFCGETVTAQENAYMSALADVDRYEVRESFLYLYAPRLPAPLRFVRE
jgi:heat shock protein HslJ